MYFHIAFNIAKKSFVYSLPPLSHRFAFCPGLTWMWLDIQVNPGSNTNLCDSCGKRVNKRCLYCIKYNVKIRKRCLCCIKCNVKIHKKCGPYKKVKVLNFQFQECLNLILKCTERVPQHILFVCKYMAVKVLTKINVESHFLQICMQLKTM